MIGPPDRRGERPGVTIGRGVLKFWTLAFGVMPVKMAKSPNHPQLEFRKWQLVHRWERIKNHPRPKPVIQSVRFRINSERGADVIQKGGYLFPKGDRTGTKSPLSVLFN